VIFIRHIGPTPPKLIFAGLLVALMLIAVPSANARDRSKALEETIITVGSELDYPPYAYVDKNGNASGFSVDLIKAAAKQVNLQLKFEVGLWAEVKAKLERGEVDALPLVAYSQERDQHFDFSRPHIISHAVIFVRKGTKGIKSLENFRGKEVIVMRGDSTHEYVISSNITDKVFLTPTVGEAIKLLSAGKHDFVIAPKLAGLLLLNELKIDNVESFGGNLEAYGKGYAFAVREGDSHLLELLDRGLVLIRTSGEYNQIYDEWFSHVDLRDRGNEKLIQNILIGAAMFGLIILMIVLWNLMLRHQVKHKTKELVDLGARYQDLYDNAPDMFASVDAETAKVKTCNKTVADNLGYTKEEIIGKPIFDLYHSSCMPEVEKAFNLFITTGKVINQELQLKRKNGSKIDVILNVSAVRDDEGKILHSRSSWRDISDRKQAEDRVRKLSQAVEQSGEGVVITNATGLIEYINPAFIKITGYSEEDAVGQNPNILKSKNQSPSFYKNMWKTLMDGETWQGKVVNKKKDGTFYPALLTISPIKSDRGEITNFIGLQQSLEKFEELEAQFHQAQKMEAIGTLVGGIAHDFNNILAGITGNLYLAKRKSNNPDVLEKLSSIEQLSCRSADLIKQLLTFARKGIIDMQPLPLNPFTKEILKLLRSSIPENIDINYNICSDTMMVNGDGTQLHQIIMNLVNNAHDAVENVNQPCIAIKLEKVHANDAFIEQHVDFELGDYAHLSIEDNGCGIPKDKIEHVFEPFFTTKAQGKGTGLGLAMVFGAIQSHGGYIEVRSIEGEGTIFDIYLPLLKTHESEENFQHDGKLAIGDGELILLVDDEIQVINASKEVLESLGYQVLDASNGLEAIDLFDANKNEISLVITDLVMPELGGVEAFEKMKEIRPDIKAIFLTGYDKGALSENKMPSNEQVVFTKPYDVIELSHAIRTQIKK